MRLAIDIGGTFTDIVARAPDGSLKNSKYLHRKMPLYRSGLLEVNTIVNHKFFFL